jgi:hypothetical protein
LDSALLIVALLTCSFYPSFAGEHNVQHSTNAKKLTTHFNVWAFISILVAAWVTGGVS